MPTVHKMLEIIKIKNSVNKCKINKILKKKKTEKKRVPTNNYGF